VSASVEAAITREQVLEIAALARRVEAHFGDVPQVWGGKTSDAQAARS